MEQRIIQFIKKPSVIQSIYVGCCMIMSFGFGILAEYSLLTQKSDPTVLLPERPVPLSLRYKAAPANIYDSIPAVSVVHPLEEVSLSTGESQVTPIQNFVASKTGSKYYPIDCGSVSRIKEENRVYFATEDEAKDKGYERTATCQ